ncbi:IS110 family transposase [Nocardia miyunensis]|uniref:IS110 family transposase n=1 Tax=Nocardia miyunensis TaxID=282684 RepID=UPI00082BE2DA|nr:transposase [Nocardia miyunensis]
MEVVHARCAGIDISKKDAKVCVRVQGAGPRATKTTVTTWGSMSSQILALREHLIAEQVTCVVMESTSDYWKPFYYLLEDGLNVMLVNPGEARNRPGRKTDVSDSAWLADLGAHGLLRASFVPPPPIRRLRDLTRARTAVLRDRARQVQRIEKILEDAGISKTRPGNRYLEAALGIAAISVSRSKNTYFAAKYRRISTRRGPMKAIVAVERAMVVAAHTMLARGEFYRDPGPNYFTARKPGPVKARAVAQLEALGYEVALHPRADTA